MHPYRVSIKNNVNDDVYKLKRRIVAQQRLINVYKQSIKLKENMVLFIKNHIRKYGLVHLTILICSFVIYFIVLGFKAMDAAERRNHNIYNINAVTCAEHQWRYTGVYHDNKAVCEDKDGIHHVAISRP